MQLRPYQERAVQQVLEYAVEHINGRILLVVPGGGGAAERRVADLEQRDSDLRNDAGEESEPR